MADEMIASRSKPTNIGDFIGDLDFDFEELKRRYDIERDRRINRGSAPLYVAAKDGKFANFGKDPWAPALTRPALHDHVQVIIAGGGFGGLLAGLGCVKPGIRPSASSTRAGTSAARGIGTLSRPDV